ncbi:hypothetical protein BD414DRAFT_496634 [Trametes punicea]|nr:hypothetical protein BD414DRAFT_496634 [Trametes punicea]
MRTCSGSQCANTLAAEWPLKRCPSCEGAAAQKAMTTACSSCRSPVTVHIRPTKAGQPLYCRSCRANALVPPTRTPNELQPRSTMGPPPPPKHFKRNVAGVAPTMRFEHTDILAAAAKFVHPDHLHVLQQHAPHPLQAIPHRHEPAYRLPFHPPPIGAPHYGPHGEVLAILPAYLRARDSNASQSQSLSGGLFVTAPFVPAHTRRTPAESVVIKGRDNALAYDKAAEKQGKASATVAEGGVKIKLKVSAKAGSTSAAEPNTSLPATRAHAAPSLKRKRTLAPFPSAPTERICVSSGCGRQIPPNVKGEFCSDCGFILWRKQFRARVAGLNTSFSAEVEGSQKNGGKEDQRHGSSRESAAIPGKSVTGDPPTVPSARSSTPWSSTVPSEDAMIVDDDVPLSVVVSRKRDSATSEKPLSANASNITSGVPVEATSRHTSPSLAGTASRTSRSPSTVRSDDEDEIMEGSQSHSSPRSSSPAPDTSHPPLKIRIKLPKRTRKSSLERQLMWDSDMSELTPLEDSMDEDESELDPWDSEDEPLANRIAALPREQDGPEEAAPPVLLPLKHRGICCVTSCANLLVEGARLRICNFCRSRKRKYQRRPKLQNLVAQDEVDGNDMIFKMPPDVDLTGYRRCRRGRCQHMIPPEKDYRWKWCPRCRIEARNRTRVMRAAAYCASDDGGDEDSPRKAPPAATVAPRDDDAHKRPPTAVKPPDSPGMPVQDGKQLPYVPAYQHFAALLAAFHSRFAEFKIAHAQYLRFKAQQEQHQDGDVDMGKPYRNPVVFRFDGEYSVVADPSGGLVDAVVHCVMRNVQAALGLSFAPIGVNPGPESSVIAVLRCVYGAQIPLCAPSPTTTATSTALAAENPSQAAEVETIPPEETPTALLVKMVGELQICVAWDRRHKFLAGQRILVLFRLVG